MFLMLNGWKLLYKHLKNKDLYKFKLNNFDLILPISNQIII